MAKTIDTVIFDLDGTLVDSQPAALGATIEALSGFGVDVTAAELREVFGGGARRLLLNFLERDLGLDQAGRVIEEAIKSRSKLQLSYTNRVALLPGVRELLDSLKDGGYQLAMATMSSKNVVGAVLGHHGIKEHFEAVLTADDVVKVKPDPEILEKTVEHLGGQISHALYVGDSGHDLEAAVQLGMPFVLVDTGIYVRGEARKKLRAAAENHGSPIVGVEELLSIFEIAGRYNQV